MKLRRIIAATTVAALAASAVAVSASAITINGLQDAGSGKFIGLIADDGSDALYTDTALLSTITKVSLTISSDSFEDMEDIKDATWFGGGFGFCSDSCGWEQHEWSFQDGVKELTWVADEKEETWTLTYDKGTPIFSANDTYAFIWIQSWDKEPFDVNIESFELLNADGVDIRTLTAETPAEPETPVEPEAPVETVEAPVEETVEVVESVETVEEPVVETVEVVESVEAPVETVEEPVEEPAVDTTAPTEGDKQSPDTGVEGIAAVAGVVALAGAAVVASRKRK